jgi:hypothetical protein
MGSDASEIRALAAQARVTATDAQVQAVADLSRVYESDASPAAGLHHIVLGRDTTCDAIQARFHYLHRGLPLHLGLEVMVLAVDGTVVDSQDFG